MAFSWIDQTEEEKTSNTRSPALLIQKLCMLFSREVRGIYIYMNFMLLMPWCRDCQSHLASRLDM